MNPDDVARANHRVQDVVREDGVREGVVRNGVVRLGVVLMPTDPWDETVRAAQYVEALGFDHLWVYDHLSWRHYRDRPWHATYPWLAGVAAATDRIRLGTMVSNLNVRHPLTLAKDAMTIDHISGGRLTIGLGAAGLGFDAEALGQAPLTPGERVARLAEAAELIDGLLRLDVHDHRGRFYEVRGARLLPGCVQRPRLPLAIAAGGAKSLRVAATYGDAWITIGDTLHGATGADATERAVAEQIDRLEQACAAIGRDPADIHRILLSGQTDERPLASLAAFTDFAGRYGEVGITDIVLHHPRSDDPVWNEPAEIVTDIAGTFYRQR